MEREPKGNPHPTIKTCYSRAVVGYNLTTGERRQWKSVRQAAEAVQELVFVDGDINKPHIVKYPSPFNPERSLIPVTIYDLATNDGLSVEDWLDWFKNYDLTKPMAVIHFTGHRYA